MFPDRWQELSSIASNGVAIVPAHGRVFRLLICFFSLCAGCNAIRAVASTSADRTGDLLSITSAKAVHDLDPQLITRAHIHIAGTITYYDPAELILFIQDRTGGVFVNVDRVYPFRPGQRIAADGPAKLGYRTGVAANSQLSVIGTGEPVIPKDVDYSLLSSGKMDCQLVSFSGRVRDAVIEHHSESNSDTLHMDLSVDDGEIEVYVKRFVHLDPMSLIGSKLKLTGVAGGSFDASEQLNGIVAYVADENGVQILHQASEDLKSIPLASIDAGFSTMRNKDLSPRLHVRGTLTYFAGGESAVLESEGKAIFLQTRQTQPLSIGEVVDAYGFADNHNYSPMLRNAVLLPSGGRQEIAPVRVKYEDAISGAYSDRLISIEGRLISEIRAAGSETLTVEAAGHVVRVLLRNTDHMPVLSLNSRLRLTGICRVITGGPWREPIMFNIAMRSPDDIVVTSEASWWSVRHLAYLLGALLFIAVIVVARILFLSGQVREQALKIERSMAIARIRGEALEQISSNASLDELIGILARGVESLIPGASSVYSKTVARSETEEGTKRKLFEIPIMSGTEQTGQFSVLSDSLCNEEGSSEVILMLREMLTVASRHARLHENLVHYSTHDPLTNLANRRLCEMKITEALTLASTFSIIYVDIDRFKEVNDSHGHSVGDLYLKAISARLFAKIAEMDTLARVGGDEFVVVMPFAGAAQEPMLIGRLHECFADPFELEGVVVHGSASFGFACFPDHGKTRDELERHADGAMYVAKQQRQQDVRTPKNLMTSAEICKALKDDRFRLVYQPQFSSGGSLTALEALIRLEDPILGTVMPNHFIPSAEASDIIVELGDWVIRTAIADAIRWHLDQHVPVIVAVNVAARQLERPDFAARVLSHLNDMGLPTRLFEIELIERAILSDNAEILRQLCLLSDAGVRISLDDFGTNCSALSLLHRLPVDTIKLDRSFVSAVCTEPRVLAVIEAITAMAQRLGHRIVAEGVETVNEVNTLLEIADMEFQGYLFSRPVPSHDIEAVLHQWRGESDLVGSIVRIECAR